MNNERILLYLAHSYLYGIKIQDPEYFIIIKYLQTLLHNKKSHKQYKEFLVNILGKSSVLTSKVILDVLKKKKYT